MKIYHKFAILGFLIGIVGLVHIKVLEWHRNTYGYDGLFTLSFALVPIELFLMWLCLYHAIPKRNSQGVEE